MHLYPWVSRLWVSYETQALCVREIQRRKVLVLLIVWSNSQRTIAVQHFSLSDLISGSIVC